MLGSFRFTTFSLHLSEGCHCPLDSCVPKSNYNCNCMRGYHVAQGPGQVLGGELRLCVGAKEAPHTYPTSSIPSRCTACPTCSASPERPKLGCSTVCSVENSISISPKARKLHCPTLVQLGYLTFHSVPCLKNHVRMEHAGGAVGFKVIIL